MTRPVNPTSGSSTNARQRTAQRPGWRVCGFGPTRRGFVAGLTRTQTRTASPQVTAPARPDRRVCGFDPSIPHLHSTNAPAPTWGGNSVSRQHRNRSTSSPGEPVYYRPNEVAKMLRCSEWWVKEQARKRRIPFSWIGGSYLFTMEHISEIVALFEQRPGSPNATQTATDARRSVRRANTITGQSVARLTARTPRRVQVARGTSAA